MEETKSSWWVAAVLASMGATGLAAVIWLSTAQAAIARPGAGSSVWKAGAAAFGCDEQISNLYLSGSFVMPGTGERLALWIGRPQSGKPAEVKGVLARSGAALCEAQCSVKRFERFKKDMKPALMELDCEGMRLKTMRMPLHIQWVREKHGFDTMVRLGSSIYGVEEAPLRLEVNRYDVVAIAK